MGMRVIAHIGNRLKLYVRVPRTCIHTRASILRNRCQCAHLVGGSELSKSETGLFFSLGSRKEASMIVVTAPTSLRQGSTDSGLLNVSLVYYFYSA
jgi:hypothetical protein